MNRRRFLQEAGLASAAALVGCSTNRPPASMPAVPVDRPVPLIVGVNGAPYGQPLPTSTYDRLNGWARPGGTVLLRTPIKSRAQADLAVSWLAPYPGLQPLFLIERPDLALVQDLASPMRGFPPVTAWGIEIVNEPNLDTDGFTALEPQAFGAHIRDARTILRTGGFTGAIISGGIWTVTEETLRDFLVPALGVWEAAGIDDVWLGLHWYADASAYTRGLVARYLGTRPCLVTEFGAHSITPAEDQAQAAYLSEQLAAFSAVPTLVGALDYQLPSGGSTSDLDNFGLQRVDGSWKPAEAVLASASRTERT